MIFDRKVYKSYSGNIFMEKVVLTKGKRLVKTLGFKRDHFDERNIALSHLENFLVSIEKKGFQAAEHSQGSAYSRSDYIDSNMAIYLPDGTCYYSKCNEEMVADLKEENTNKVIRHTIQNPNWTFVNSIRPLKLVNVLKDALGFSFSYPRQIFEEHRKRPYVEFLYKNNMEHAIIFLITASNDNQSCFYNRPHGSGLNFSYPLDKARIDVRASDEINLKEIIAN